jgi:hypothetical protein
MEKDINYYFGGYDMSHDMFRFNIERMQILLYNTESITGL